MYGSFLSSGPPRRSMSPYGQPCANRGLFPSPTTPKHGSGTNIENYNPNGTLRTGGSTTIKLLGVTGQPGRLATGLSAQNDNKGTINLRKNIKDPLLTRQSEKAYNNADVKRGIEELESKLERGIEQPGLGSKIVAKGIKEHRHKGGGRTYIKRKDETIYELVARSGKRKSDQRAVINRLKEIYMVANNGKKSNILIEINEDLQNIDDIYNANVEVFVTLNNGFTLTIIVGTPKNLQYIMNKDHTNFYGPGLPWIIVQKLTKSIIEEAIMAYFHDRPNAYWLQLCHFALDINPFIFDELQQRETDMDSP